MITKEELELLFRDMETDRVERKRSLTANSDRILQAICAHANDLPNHRKPGVIFIGQNDDGSCAGTNIDDEILKTLGGMRSDGKLLPFPVMSVRREIIDGCTVAAIIVLPSEQPPVRLDARCWIRVGPRRAMATIEEERRLAEKQVWHNLTFDARPCGDADLDDLDLLRFEQEYVPSATSPEIRRQNGRTSIEKLRALRMITKNNQPTNASVLLFGKDPRAFFPGAYIQFLRINGRELTDQILDQKEINGGIPDQIRQIEELIKLNIRTPTKIGGAQRNDQPDYPIEALEQLCRNAILHRTYESTMPIKIHWYSDRIEIINPGGLYGDVTPETIFQNITAYRNPIIAEGMKNLGIVERFGMGLAIAKKALSQNKSQALQYYFEPNFVMFAIGGPR